MEHILLLALLLIAIASGFFLGRYSLRKSKGSELNQLTGTYIKGFNFLLNEQPDSAIDAFVASLEVNSHTLETHLALGKLLRRKGEVERAIRVHQNLLARPSLPITDQHQAQLELAEDYIAAGLLDRAERLLQELMEVSSSHKILCLKHLVRIYSDEREWEKAIHAASILSSKKVGRGEYDLSIEQSHFCCEIAEDALNSGDYLSARRSLQQALSLDKNCVRASLILGHLESKMGRPKDALKALKRISYQNPDYISESLELLKTCYQQSGDAKGWHKLLDKYLKTENPRGEIILAMTDILSNEKGEAAAASFIGEAMKQTPSLIGVIKLVDFHISHAKGESKSNLQLLKKLLQHVVSTQPSYRCNSCGFSGKTLHWQCPSCKSWGTSKALQYKI